ncbi:hypothetical protein EMA8858_01516 [Emticicia aquatica]|uniref:DUF4293 family protein n=1 Tax=Emticicia aquatica TaxID=1681835 RepID=A0ABM9AP31_9BACT|nr:hypothetical protein [Emticicia aquatica]CAH0995395.1 hypothetical protein EMA8858_01516 [Emticicia aquatica]
MFKKIPFKIAINIILLLIGFIIIFHFLVLTQTIPFNIVWGGKLKNESEMIRLEAISITINILLIFVILIKGNYLKLNFSVKLLNAILWLFILLFALNTIGNLLAESSIETIIFTPMTFILSILCLRIVIEK